MGQHEVGDQIILRLLAPLDRQASNVCAHLDDSIFGTLLTLLPDHRIDVANYVAGEMFLALLVVSLRIVPSSGDREGRSGKSAYRE
jgi:hypothetical protein